MLVLFLALSAAAPPNADIRAASDKLMANSALMHSLFGHAAPVERCTFRKIKAATPATTPKVDPEKDYQAFTKQLALAAKDCGLVAEFQFWVGSIKAAYPDFSDPIVNTLAFNALYFMIFDGVINGIDG